MGETYGFDKLMRVVGGPYGILFVFFIKIGPQPSSLYTPFSPTLSSSKFLTQTHLRLSPSITTTYYFAAQKLYTQRIISLPLRTNQEMRQMKMMGSSEHGAAAVRNSKKNKLSCRRLGGYLRQQKGRLYIIRTCVVMLLCWHD
ncbi:uncharacterized protein LOC110807226 [Carica papaya]|uniref:uncharacterized protein LOC110807226 n=1 Tax=Carica papaya TaxID=3649 RepID=UPI000B8CB679|nr:uncharacterized protein LOC110807226 [Carica papaya]